MHPFVTPCTVLCTGSSGAGKTEWLFRVLKNKHLMWESNPPVNVKYCYGIWTKLYDRMLEEIPGISFHKGLPTEQEIMEFSDPDVHKLVVFDDLMDVASSSSIVQLIFVMISHHRQLSAWYNAQNINIKGSSQVTIGLNSRYLIFFRSPRSLLQIQYINSQIFPGKKSYLASSYKQALQLDKFGYILVDNTPHCPDQLRVRFRVLPQETTIYFLPHNDNKLL